MVKCYCSAWIIIIFTDAQLKAQVNWGSCHLGPKCNIDSKGENVKHIFSSKQVLDILVEQELLILPEHRSSSPALMGFVLLDR